MTNTKAIELLNEHDKTQDYAIFRLQKEISELRDMIDKLVKLLPEDQQKNVQAEALKIRRYDPKTGKFQ